MVLDYFISLMALWDGDNLCNSNGYSISRSRGIRPVVELKATIKVDSSGTISLN